jgi:AraC family transcriptional regulator of adaptative response/methylated-DNA-[protein]-cysteine methyltransferase
MLKIISARIGWLFGIKNFILFLKLKTECFEYWNMQEDKMKNEKTQFEKFSEIYYRIEKALLQIEKRYKEQPVLEEIANDSYLSKYHFQRLFKQFVGLSPKKFLQYLTVENAKKLLEKSRSVLDTTYEVGLSSPGRLHDLFINCEAMTPGEYKEKGKGMKIIYGIHPTIFGVCIISTTEKGICGFDFLLKNEYKDKLNEIKKRWEFSDFHRDDDSTKKYVDYIFGHSKNRPIINLILKGTDFQIKVWQALLKIPEGAICSYEEISKFIGNKNSVRAVVNAVAKNPIGYIIPCHRVIRKMGIIGDYHWGKPRKKAILGWELSKTKKSIEV